MIDNRLDKKMANSGVNGRYVCDHRGRRQSLSSLRRALPLC